MNQGIFGFPAALGGVVLSTKQIDVSGTYLIAPGTKRLVIFLVGGGGGGGAGGKRASATAQTGGSSGSGGSQAYQDFAVEDLGGVNTTLSIIIGAGGLAGATAGDTAAGGAGGAGGTTSITPTGKPGILMDCLGGVAGAGGTTTTTTGGAARSGWAYGAAMTHTIGGGSTATTGAPVNVPVSNINQHAGAGGAGLAATPVAQNGGIIYLNSISSSPCVLNPDIGRGQNVYVGGTNTVAPIDSYLHIMSKMSPGFGGAGGGSGTTGATKGGNGFRGSGGGGGGSTLNTFTAGGGGVGGNGYVCIVALA